MQNNRVKRLIILYALPTISMVALLLGIFMDYRKQNIKLVDSVVENNIEQTGGTYSRNISVALNAMKGVTDIVDAMMEEYAAGNINQMVESLEVTKNSYAAFSVVFCNTEGVVTTGYENVDLTSTDYFARLQGEEPFFSYTVNDGLTGEEAFFYVTPIIYDEKIQGYLIAYMKPEILEEIFRDGNGYGDEAFYAIISDEGTVLASFEGVNSTSLLENDFWNGIKKDTTVDGSWNVFDKQRERRQFGKLKITKGEEQRILCHFPIEYTEWSLVMGLQQEYADKMLGKLWKPMAWLVVKMGICLIVYLTIVVVLNVLSRIRNSEQKRELENKADTDLLTDLNNKIATERKIREYMMTNPNEQGVLFVLDVDNFKKINDTLGHSFGDEVLRNLGMRLKSMFRLTDIVGRIGGDEFIIFLKNVQDDAVIEREGKKIETFFHGFEVGEYVKYSVTASIGGAVFPRDAANFENLYKAADKAVYISKKQGKNRLTFYHKDDK